MNREIPLERSAGSLTALPWIGFLDQGLSSLTNFAATFVGLVSLTTSGFGAFSIAFAWYVIVIGTTRAIVAEPQAVRYASSPPEEFRRMTSSAAGSALVLGAVAGIGICLAALLLGGGASGPLLILALLLPMLALQDSYRMSFIITRQYTRALTNDGVWALCLIPILGILLVDDSLGATALIAAWAGTGAIAGLVGVFQSRSLPHLGALRGWLRSEGSLSYRFAAEFGLQRGSYELALILILMVSDLEVVGSIGGARFFFAPLTVVFLSAQVVGIPEMVRVLDRDWTLFTRTSVVLVVGLSTLGLVAGIVLWFLRDVLEQLVGSTWADVEALLLPMSIFVAVGGGLLGVMISMRAMAAARESVRAAALAAVAILVCAPVMTVGRGALGAAWGLAIGGTLGLIAWLVMAGVARRRVRPAESAP